MCERLMTVKDVAAALKVSERMVWKLVASGRFPQPARLGRSVRWKSIADIQRFIECGCDMQAYHAAQGEPVGKETVKCATNS